MTRRPKTGRPPTGRPNTGRIRRPRNRRTGTQRDLKLPVRRIQLAQFTRVIVAVVVLGGTLVAAKAGWQCVQTAERLEVRTVDVRGANRLGWPDIEAYTGIHVGQGILEVDLDDTAKALSRHPWVASAKIRRQLPNHLVVEVTEHVGQMVVVAGVPYLANGEGELFKRLSSADQVTLPVLSGLSRTFLSDHPQRSKEVVMDGLALSLAVEDAALGTVAEVVWDEALGWSVVVQRPSPVMLHLGEHPIERLDLVAEAFDRLARLRRQPQTIWADGTAYPQRVQVSLAAITTQSTSTSQTLIAKGR